MSSTHEITCIGCPLGCEVRLTVNERGEIIEFTGHECKIGKQYAEQEYKSPQRVLATTVRTAGSIRRLLPVRGDKPVPKDKLRQCVQFLANTEVQPQLRMGEVIVSNILGTGANVICTDDLLN